MEWQITLPRIVLAICILVALVYLWKILWDELITKLFPGKEAEKPQDETKENDN